MIVPSEGVQGTSMQATTSMAQFWEVVAMRGTEGSSKVAFWAMPGGHRARHSSEIFQNPEFRVHAKGVILCEMACFCLLSTF